MKIPSKENRDPRRLVPGHDDVFIIPKSDCVPDAKEEYHFYPNENIVSCFILKAPGSQLGCETLIIVQYHKVMQWSGFSFRLHKMYTRAYRALCHCNEV